MGKKRKMGRENWREGENWKVTGVGSSTAMVKKKRLERMRGRESMELVTRMVKELVMHLLMATPTVQVMAKAWGAVKTSLKEVGKGIAKPWVMSTVKGLASLTVMPMGRLTVGRTVTGRRTPMAKLAVMVTATLRVIVTPMVMGC